MVAVATNIPVLAAGGVTAAAANPLLPLKNIDQAILALNAPDFAYLTTAFWAGLRKSGQPVDMMTGASYGTSGATTNLPPIMSPDAVFAGEDSLDFSTTTLAAMRTPAGVAKQSGTIILLYATKDSTATGPIFWEQNGSAAYGVGVSQNSSSVFAQIPYGGTGVCTAPRSRQYEGGANILVVSYDATTKQTVIYLNGLTPIIGTAGAQSTYPDLGTTSFIQWGGTGNASDGIRMSRGYACSVSLHHTVGGPARIRSIINAAAADFSIPLRD